jgi:ATP-dependent exoDNAse (exonuclease V) beta subunit
VFILADTLRETSQEEMNICYVAITRAKKELVWVGSKKEEGR